MSPAREKAVRGLGFKVLAQRGGTMKDCPSCGSWNSDDASFCRHCGSALLGGPSRATAGNEARQNQPGFTPPSPPPGQHPAHLTPQGSLGTKSSGKATASLVCGIIGLIVFPVIFSVLAINLGLAAKREISRSGGQLSGEGKATAGIVLGIVGLVFGVIFLVLTLAR